MTMRGKLIELSEYTRCTFVYIIGTNLSLLF